MMTTAEDNVRNIITFLGSFFVTIKAHTWPPIKAEYADSLQSETDLDSWIVYPSQEMKNKLSIIHEIDVPDSSTHCLLNFKLVRYFSLYDVKKILPCFQSLVDYARSLPNKDLTNDELELIELLAKGIKGHVGFHGVTSNTATKLNRLIKLADDPVLVAKFQTLLVDEHQEIEFDVNTLSEDVKSLKKYIEVFTGIKDRVYITPDEKTEHNLSDEVWKTYLAKRRLINSNYKLFVRHFVRNQSDEINGVYLSDAQDLRKKALELGFPENYPPSADFVGYIDEDNFFYTVVGKKINGRPSGVVVMNTGYDPEADNAYVLRYQAPGAKNWSSLYTLDYRSEITVSTKFDRINELADNADELIEKWRKDLRNKDPYIKMCAMMTELLYLTGMRPGSKLGKTGDTTTYGLTTLLAQHFKTTPSETNIRFISKSGGDSHYVIKGKDPSSKLLVAYLNTQLNKVPTEDDFFWAIYPEKTKKPARGRTPTRSARRVTSRDLIKYIRGLSPDLAVKAKDFRTLLGTQLFMREMKKHEPLKEMGSKEAHTLLDNIAQVVGSALRHYRKKDEGKEPTGATALVNYIDPALVGKFFERVNVRMNRNIEKIVKARR